jgi:TIR domain
VSKIVISYRRSDSQDIAMRVRDVMALHFGKNSVFTDIDSIPLGVDFLEYIERQLSACDALIAIVGPHWVDAGKGRGQGVHLETDFVRIEVESALKRKIPVIPALVAGALMPRPDELPDALHQFAFRNATAIDSGLNFRNDVARLIRSLDATFAASNTKSQ